MAQKIVYILLCAIIFQASITNAEKVKITDVKALTFKKGLMTTGRRSAPLPQLQCNGHLCLHSPETIQCVNVGSNGNNMQWKCEADLPETLSLRIDAHRGVNCEGYEYPTDPYILYGSCGLTYSITGHMPASQKMRPSDRRQVESNAAGVGFVGIGFLVLLLLCSSGGTRRGYYGGGYYGGGPSAGTTAAAAAVGAAAGSFWGHGGRRRRRSRWGGWGSGASSRSRSTRTSTGFCGTSRR